MKLIPRQQIWLAIVLVTNLALWLIPSNVVEQIARDRHTMLGRYSRTHFYWIVGVAALSVISLYIDWSTGERYKRRWFQVIAGALLFFPTLILGDFLLRSPQSDHYVKDRFAYHRPADAGFEVTFTDQPAAQRSYPHVRPGYGEVLCALRTDRRGFRNSVALERCDVLVLGDSFAEGSNVSDEHVWFRRLAERSGLAVYNLGMSGYDPLHYLKSLKDYGLSLQPRYVLCMLYEGNDFRSAKTDTKRLHPSIGMRLHAYFDRSPILKQLDELLIGVFGSINSRGPVKGGEMLDWLPLGIPEGTKARFYAFEPKQLRDLYITREEFSLDRHWLNPRSLLAEMNELCRKNGSMLVVVYAPTKAHVTLQLAADRLPAEKVRAFTSLSRSDELPEPATFLADLMARADAKESVVEDWCRRESVAFCSMTQALRTAIGHGIQTYYTYDQHWTPDGHEVVAETLHQYLLAAVPNATLSANDPREAIRTD